jgi:hypothetical protein
LRKVKKGKHNEQPIRLAHDDAKKRSRSHSQSSIDMPIPIPIPVQAQAAVSPMSLSFTCTSTSSLSKLTGSSTTDAGADADADANRYHDLARQQLENEKKKLFDEIKEYRDIADYATLNIDVQRILLNADAFLGNIDSIQTKLDASRRELQLTIRLTVSYEEELQKSQDEGERLSGMDDGYGSWPRWDADLRKCVYLLYKSYVRTYMQFWIDKQQSITKGKNKIKRAYACVCQCRAEQSSCTILYDS